MPDVSSTAPAVVRMRVALDVHKRSIVCASAAADRRRAARCARGDPEHRARDPRPHRAARRAGAGWRSATRPGPCGYDPIGCSARSGWRATSIAPSLVPVRAGARVKTDRRDAKKLLLLHRAGALTFVYPPTPAQEGLRDLVRCRDDLRCARTARAPPRGQAAAALRAHLPRGQEGLDQAPHRVGAPPAARAIRSRSAALEHMLAHLDGVDAQLAALDARARRDRRTASRGATRSRWLCCFRGIAHPDRARAAGRDRRLPPLRHRARADELPRADPQRVLLRRSAPPRPHHQDRQPPRPPAADRGRLALPARPPRQPTHRRAAEPRPARRRRARLQAQIRLHHRHRHLTDHSKRSTVATVAVARELAGFLWAAMTHQPLRTDPEPDRRPPNPTHRWGGAAGAARRRTLDSSMRSRLATLVRGSSRRGTVMRSRPAHLRVTCRRCRRAGRPAPAPRHDRHNTHSPPAALDSGVHLRTASAPGDRGDDRAVRQGVADVVRDRGVDLGRDHQDGQPEVLEPVGQVVMHPAGE